MHQLGRFTRTVARVLRTHYPGFIFGLPLRRDEIPVFTYHDVEPAGFARDLEFLEANGYRTLSLNEFLAARVGKHRCGRCVLLTFDDARKSFWEVAMPLLRTFEARAVLFAPSYWMASARHHAAADDLFMNWEQLRACLASGLVDIQSHAHRHALVAVEPQLVDFASPRTLARFDIYDWPMRFRNGADELGRPKPGTPVYRAEPLLSAPHRYLENDELALVCEGFVARNGGVEYFSRSDWLPRLRSFHREFAGRMPGRRMDTAAFLALVRSEFESSRDEFQKHLGYAPRCIAYPWMLGSPSSLQLAQRAGFSAAFGVALDYGAERSSRGAELPVFGRLKCDWLQFLPGAHRASVFAAMGRKLTGVGKLQHLAH